MGTPQRAFGDGGRGKHVEPPQGTVEVLPVVPVPEADARDMDAAGGPA